MKKAEVSPEISRKDCFSGNRQLDVCLTDVFILVGSVAFTLCFPSCYAAGIILILRACQHA